MAKRRMMRIYMTPSEQRKIRQKLLVLRGMLMGDWEQYLADVRIIELEEFLTDVDETTQSVLEIVDRIIRRREQMPDPRDNGG